MRAWPWLAHTRYAYAQMLRLRSSAGDEQRAHALLDEVLEAAVRLTLVALGQKLRGREHLAETTRAGTPAGPAHGRRYDTRPVGPRAGSECVRPLTPRLSQTHKQQTTHTL